MTPHAHPSKYQITIENELDDHWLRFFEDLEIIRTTEGKTVISGMMDQAALHGILNRLRDLGLEIEAVLKIKTDCIDEREMR